jgi:hypothetical protein
MDKKKAKTPSQTDRLEVERNTLYIFTLPFYLDNNIEKVAEKMAPRQQQKTAFLTLFHRC